MRRWICGALAGLLMCTAGVPALAAETAPKAEATAPEEEAPEPDGAGTVSWENLRGRIEAGSLNALVLTENIGTITAMDYEEMTDQLRTQLNALADVQWYATLMGSEYTANTMGQTYSSVREVFDSIQDGDMQKDNADAVRQLELGKNQVLSGGEQLYLGILTMERSARDGERGLAALDRSLEELRLRQKLGQVSALAVQEVEQTRASVASQLATLDANLTTYKVQLQTMLGVEPDGKLELLPLPELDGETLDAMDCEADLEAAKAASWTLYEAGETLRDAREEWLDSWATSYRYQQRMAEHTWKAAQITYESTVQNFETAFRTLYRTVQDQRQALAEKEQAAAYQEKALEAVRAQYELGRISRSALRTAEDEAASAQSELESARQALFAAYLAYRSAVDYGITG